ncbi:MAG: pilus assembly protein [Burkholderia sp.]|nr:pilus assembly protein [Burkholderia sp.]
MRNNDTNLMRAAYRRPYQRGASLLEGIAYLGIAAIVVLGAVSLLTGALGSAKSNQTTEELVALRTTVKKLYVGQPYPNGSLVPTLVTAKAIPSTLVPNAAGDAITNTWGGAVTITGSAAGTTFTVTYAAVPQDVCVGAISGMTGWTSISQGSTSISTFPITAANATSICSVTAATGNSVTFTAS